MRARRLDERETIECQIGCQFVKAASLITLHERLSKHGEDDEMHNRAMDTSARLRVSCLSSPPSRILAAAEEAVKYSFVSSSVTIQCVLSKINVLSASLAITK